MKRKSLPLIMMLFAGAVTCIITFIQGYDLLTKILILFAVLVLFYVLGCIMKFTLDKFEKQNEEKNKQDGEVIEKESEAQTQTQES